MLSLLAWTRVTYSFGIVLWEIAHPGKVPDTNPTWTGRHCATDKDRPPVRRDRPLAARRAWDAYKDLMKHCWAQEPKDRPSFEKVHRELTELLANTRG